MDEKFPSNPSWVILQELATEWWYLGHVGFAVQGWALSSVSCWVNLWLLICHKLPMWHLEGHSAFLGPFLSMKTGWVKVSLTVLQSSYSAENGKPPTEGLKEFRTPLRENSCLGINLRGKFQMSIDSNTPRFLMVKRECQLPWMVCTSAQLKQDPRSAAETKNFSLPSCPDAPSSTFSKGLTLPSSGSREGHQEAGTWATPSWRISLGPSVGRHLLTPLGANLNALATVSPCLFFWKSNSHSWLFFC